METKKRKNSKKLGPREPAQLKRNRKKFEKEREEWIRKKRSLES